MAQVVVSAKYQVVIPRDVRREIGLRSGQVLQIVSKGGIITMVPDQPIAAMRGYLKGMKKTPLREKKDRE